MLNQFIRRKNQTKAGAFGAAATLFYALALLVLLSLQAVAGDRTVDKYTSFHKSHQVGIRLGAWASQGEKPADSVPTAYEGLYYLTDFTSGNAYMEGFFAYRLSPHFAGALSVGIVSRGDVTLQETGLINRTSFGSMVVYPILLKARFYPLGAAYTRFHPYVSLGGGLYYGKHDVQIVTNNIPLTADLDQSSETKLGYVVGGGFDWPVAEVIALELNAQYMPIKFSKNLVGAKDYSSLTITIGVKYLFRSKGEKR
ncbi:MAG: outer membrane beta-barrel protein [bacterium]|nr:outer membrane beta-barrel protein [bacterium]